MNLKNCPCKLVYKVVSSSSIAYSLAFAFSSAQLCDQSIRPKRRPRLPPCLIGHSALTDMRPRRDRLWSLSICLHVGTKTASSGGWRSPNLTPFHPRMTHLSLDSLILISLFSPVCLHLILSAQLNSGEAPVIDETPTSWDKSEKTILGRHLTILSKHKTTQQQNQTITSLNTKWISGCLKDFTSFHSFGNPSQRCLTAGYHANEPFAVNKLTLAASWDVRVATFSWEASSSRRSFLICWLKEEKRKVNVWLHMNATKEALSCIASPA